MKYEYRCNECKSIFLRVMSFSEFDEVKNKKIKCVHCGKKIATRVILTSPSIEFRGDGFYSTDNKQEPEHNVVELTNG